MNLSKVFDFIGKHEVWLYYLLVLVNLIPLFVGTYFPTIDGAAHLYNSRLILELIGGSSSAVDQFYQLNELVPNLSGHVLVALFMTVLPPFLAEKLFLVIYAVGLPLSFRYLLKSTPSANVLFSYFILPFVYSYLFLLGFYNFSISLVFMFLAIGYWLKRSSEKISIGSIILLSFLCFLTFTSHLVIYGLLFSFLLAQMATAYIRWFINRREKGRFADVTWLKQLGVLLIANLIPLFFTGLYFFKRPQTGSNYEFISWAERLMYFTDFRPLIAFNYEIELAYTKVLFPLFILLIVLAGLFTVRNYFARNKMKSSRNGFFVKLVNQRSFFPAIICLISFTAFLILPDSDGYGGYISVRMALLFLIFVIYWFAAAIPQKWIAALCTPVIIYVVLGLNIYYSKVINGLNPLAKEIVSISDLIEENSIVIPIDVSNNWLLGHHSNYLGVKKPMVILENYEANSGYFPVKWNTNKAKVNFLREGWSSCSAVYPLTENEDAFQIDYLFVLGTFSSLSQDCQEIISKDQEMFEKVYESETSFLIKLNN